MGAQDSNNHTYINNIKHTVHIRHTVHTHMHARTHTHIHARTHAHCTHVCTHVPTHAHMYSRTQRWGSYVLFKSNLLIITITYNIKYFVTVTDYLENEVTVIILHIILLLRTTQQVSNNVSYSYQIEKNLANEQHHTYS